MRSKRWVSNEMMTFGIPEGKVAEFLEQRGFTQVQDADAEYLHATYFTGENAKRTVAYGYAIASAVIKS
jgi:O-methyltransferase involved in polyketide biosynthesis